MVLASWKLRPDESPWADVTRGVLRHPAVGGAIHPKQFLSTLEGPHVRQCAAKDCALFFVDRTPSARRVWCEMKTCGHRVKSLRHYHRLGKKNRPKNWLYR